MLGTVTVGNLRDTQDGVRCDRATAMGNPFDMKRESDRDAACNAYRKYAWLFLFQGYDQRTAAEKVSKETGLPISSKFRTSTTCASFIHSMGRQVGEGRDYLLLCWCAPKRCHCEILRDAIYYIAEQSQCSKNSVSKSSPGVAKSTVTGT